MILKYAVLVLVCGLVVCSKKVDIPPDLQKIIDDSHAECLKQIGATEDDFKTFDINVKNPKMMCYMKCLFVINDWMNADAELQFDYIKENVHHSVRHITLPELDNCGKTTEGAVDCEKAYNFYYCMHLKEPEDWVLV